MNKPLVLIPMALFLLGHILAATAKDPAPPAPTVTCPSRSERADLIVVPQDPNPIKMDEASALYIVNNIPANAAEEMFGNIDPTAAETLIQQLSPEQAQIVYEYQDNNIQDITPEDFNSLFPDTTSFTDDVLSQLFQTTTPAQARAIKQSALVTALATMQSPQEQILFKTLAPAISNDPLNTLRLDDWNAFLKTSNSLASLAKGYLSSKVPAASSSTVAAAIAAKMTITVTPMAAEAGPGGGAIQAGSKLLISAPAPGTQATPISIEVPATMLATYFATLSPQDADWVYSHSMNKPALITDIQNSSSDQLAAILTQVSTAQVKSLRSSLNQDDWKNIFPMGAVGNKAPSPSQAQLLLRAIVDSAKAKKLFANIAGEDLLPLLKQFSSRESQVLLDAYLPAKSAPVKVSPEQAQKLSQGTETLFDSTATTNDVMTTYQQVSQIAASSKSAAPSEETLSEADLINGAAQFIASRTKAEAEEIATDRVLTTLCQSKSGGLAAMFPETCMLENRRAQPTSLSVANTYTALVAALRDDLEYVPACILSRAKQTNIGYQMQSIYRQNSNQTSLDTLIYGLANSGDLNTVASEDPTASRALLCTYNSGGHFIGEMCGIVIPIMAYAAIIRVVNNYDKTTVDLNSVLVQRLLANAFEQSFDELADANGFCRMSDSRQPCPLKSDIDNWIKQIDTNNTATVTLIISRIASIRTEIASIVKQYNNQYAGSHPPTRDELAQTLLTIGSSTFDEIYASTRLVVQSVNEPLDDSKKLMAYVTLMEDLQGVYSAMEAQEYSLALVRAQPILQCLPENTQVDDRSGDGGNAEIMPDYCPGGWKVDGDASDIVSNIQRVGGAVGALADAKSSDDVENTLDQLAAPLDAWKLRHEETMWTINGYGGLALGETTYDVPGVPAVGDKFYAVFAPIGFSLTTPSVNDKYGAYGVFLGLVDLGNIIAQPKDVDFPGGRITGNVDSKISKVFTPGIYITWYPSREYPIAFYAGVTHGPSEFREIQYDTPHAETDYASRKTTVMIGLAFDVVMFQLR